MLDAFNVNTWALFSFIPRFLARPNRIQRPSAGTFDENTIEDSVNECEEGTLIPSEAQDDECNDVVVDVGVLRMD